MWCDGDDQVQQYQGYVGCGVMVMTRSSITRGVGVMMTRPSSTRVVQGCGLWGGGDIQVQHCQCYAEGVKCGGGRESCSIY